MNPEGHIPLLSTVDSFICYMYVMTLCEHALQLLPSQKTLVINEQ